MKMYTVAFISLALILVFCEGGGTPKPFKPCPTSELQFGRFRLRQRGKFIRFMCNLGYILAGDKYSTCHNGVWDSPQPRCVRASCTKVNPPINGLIYPSHRGAVLNFFCKPGYELRGTNISYCDGKNWDNKLPACLPSNTQPQLSCDFESPDLCGWNHDVKHDFDWIRMNLRTPSGHLGTGPSYDHTQGQGAGGYYMYIESSSRRENDTARLISPIYDGSETDVCLEFYYHMHGVSTGQLRVYVKKFSESWDLDPEKAVFWKSGNHGDVWLRSLTNIGSMGEDFQIVIEGVRGSSYFSDIAIDDISIIENCTIEETSTENDFTVTDDDFPLMQSCQNRCDNDNVIVSPTGVPQIACGCNDSCFDDNSCCPDYIAICILGDDFGNADTTIAMMTTEISTTTENVYTTIVSTTEKQNNTNLKATTATNKIYTTTGKPTNIILNTTITKQNDTIESRTTKKIDANPISPTTKPTVVIQSTTQKVDVVTLKSVPIISTSESSEDDMVTLPEPATEDVTYYAELPSPFPSIIINIKEESVKEEKSHSNILLITLVASVSVILIAIVGVLLARRYNYTSCRNVQKMKSSGDSQSDVRFLTSDEVLDFNLAYSDDFN